MEKDFENELLNISKLISEKKYKEVESIYKKLLEDNPDHMGLKDWLWKLYILMWEKEKAWEYISDDWAIWDWESIDKEVKKEFLNINKFITRGKYKEAEKMFNNLLKKYPNHLWVKDWLDKLHIMMKKNK